MKKLSKKQIKYIIIGAVVLIAIIAGSMIYKNLFASIDSTRLSGIKEHKITNNEMNAVKDNLSALENIDSVDVYTNYKIIKIFIKLKDDIDVEKLKEASNNSLSKFSSKNLEYYDVELFVESNNKSSKVYPIIGYKHKTSKDFVW